MRTREILFNSDQSKVVFVCNHKIVLMDNDLQQYQFFISQPDQSVNEYFEFKFADTDKYLLLLDRKVAKEKVLIMKSFSGTGEWT